MELLAFIAGCFVVWKLIDSIGSKTENKDTVRRTTTITDNGKGNTTVHTVVSEEFTRSSAHGSLNLNNTPSDLRDEDITGINAPPHFTPHQSGIQQSHTTQTIDSQQRTARALGRDHSIQPSQTTPTNSPQIERIPSSPSGLTTKTCGKCGKTKPAVSEFFRSSKQADGFSAWCRSCHDEKQNDDRHYKKCPKCSKRRLKTNFYHSDKNPDGLTKWCRYCLDGLKKQR